MSNEDNACIRYLMKEMDPSEEVLMERAMMEDEDLLIEVECMRQTLKRIDKGLPLVDPPSHITQKIIDQAAKQKKTTLIPGQQWRYGVSAAAAVVLVGVLSGVLWFHTDSTQTDPATENSPAVSRSVAVTASPSYEYSKPQTTDNRQEIQPWVDRNELLRFQDQFSSEHRADFDSILNSSTEKLKLINDTGYLNSRPRSLQLTGSDK